MATAQGEKSPEGDFESLEVEVDVEEELRSVHLSGKVTPLLTSAKPEPLLTMRSCWMLKIFLAASTLTAPPLSTASWA